MDILARRSSGLTVALVLLVALQPTALPVAVSAPSPKRGGNIVKAAKMLRR